MEVSIIRFTPILAFPHQGGRDFERHLQPFLAFAYPCQSIMGEGTDIWQ